MRDWKIGEYISFKHNGVRNRPLYRIDDILFRDTENVQYLLLPMYKSDRTYFYYFGYRNDGYQQANRFQMMGSDVVHISEEEVTLELLGL